MADPTLPRRLPTLVLWTGMLGLCVGAILFAVGPRAASLPPEHPLYGR